MDLSLIHYPLGDCNYKDRPNWHQYFLEIAKTVSLRSTCPRASVGCVIVQDNIVISTGYNGAYKGSPHCSDNRCSVLNDHCINSVHAEYNAVKRLGVSANVLKAYVTHKPCEACCVHIKKANVDEVYYINEYP